MLHCGHSPPRTFIRWWRALIRGRSNEMRYSRMRAAPDGCRRLDGARGSSQLPKLPNKKVVIVDTPSRSTSSSIEENLGFWIDEAAKTLVLTDGTPLTVRRFGDHWISAAHGDI